MTTYERIYRVVRRVPKGRVATYGQVATVAGLPGHARQVGYALHALQNDSDVPWHRVVNAQGAISLRAEPGYEDLQRMLLEQEGVAFSEKGRISLPRFGWRAGARASASKRQPAASRPSLSRSGKQSAKQSDKQAGKPSANRSAKGKVAASRRAR